jgi:hypothetical protein
MLLKLTILAKLSRYGIFAAMYDIFNLLFSDGVVIPLVLPALAVDVTSEQWFDDVYYYSYHIF